MRKSSETWKTQRVLELGDHSIFALILGSFFVDGEPRTKCGVKFLFFTGSLFFF